MAGFKADSKRRKNLQIAAPGSAGEETKTHNKQVVKSFIHRKLQCRSLWLAALIPNLASPMLINA